MVLLAVFPYFFRNETLQREEVFCIAISASKRFIEAIAQHSRKIFIFCHIMGGSGEKENCRVVCYDKKHRKSQGPDPPPPKEPPLDQGQSKH